MEKEELESEICTTFMLPGLLSICKDWEQTGEDLLCFPCAHHHIETVILPHHRLLIQIVPTKAQSSFRREPEEIISLSFSRLAHTFRARPFLGCPFSMGESYKRQEELAAVKVKRKSLCKSGKNIIM